VRSVTERRSASALAGGPSCNTKAKSSRLVPELAIEPRDTRRAGREFYRCPRRVIQHGRLTSAVPEVAFGVLRTAARHVVIAGVSRRAPAKSRFTARETCVSVDGNDVKRRRLLYDALRQSSPRRKHQLKVLRDNRVTRSRIPPIRAEDYFAIVT